MMLMRRLRPIGTNHYDYNDAELPSLIHRSTSQFVNLPSKVTRMQAMKIINNLDKSHASYNFKAIRAL